MQVGFGKNYMAGERKTYWETDAKSKYVCSNPISNIYTSIYMECLLMENKIETDGV